MSQLSEWLDYVYENVKTFDVRKGLPCTLKGLWRCPAVFKTGELSIVYVRSEDGDTVRGAVICSDSFCGVRGDVTDEELDFVRSHHTDLDIRRDV